MAFLDHLISQGVLKRSEAEKIAERTQNGMDIDTVLKESGISSDKLATLRSEYFNIPVGTASGLEVPFEVLKNVPEESAMYYKFVPLGITDGVLEIGIVDPGNTAARDAIQFISSKLGKPFKLYVISQADFESIVGQYKGLTGEVNKALSELETELDREEKKEESSLDKGISEIDNDISRTQIIEEAPVTKIVAVVLRHAIEGNASDIHIEPTADKVRVRFRVDGVMYTSLLLPNKVLNPVVARIKILSSTMKLDERRKPQDGRFSARIEGRKVDFRVSTFPTYYGEKVVMRILDSEKGVKSLEELGLTEENVKTVRDAISQPYGLILLTGPTGSGKTTTLYSMLNEIDRDKNNVLSLEDPVEYNISGMSQSQVRPEIGYTFASGLRSILRQDPDIIMVGEIRDKETAQLAIQAALTGHLVLSTLHTNNAAGVIPRLVDMGVDPYLIAPTLILAIAQRLAKTICPDEKAREPLPMEGSREMMIQKMTEGLPADRKELFTGKHQVYKAVPTDECPTGTRGRIGVFELLSAGSTVENVIIKHPVEEEVFKVAREQGMLTMKEDAMLKAFNGVIPFDEVNKL